MQKIFSMYFITIPFLLFSLACQTNMSYSLSEQGLQKYIAEYEKVVEPLMTDRNQAEWDAYTSGKKEFFDATTKYSLKIDSVHQKNNHFLYLKKLKEENVITDPILRRQLDILYTEFLEGQINPDLNREITELASTIEGIFANFRTTLEGKTYTDNQVTDILKTEKKIKFREQIWRAQKSLGNEVVDHIRTLAKLRNKAARELGYKNYFYMAMDSRELDPDEVTSIFDELYTLTKKPYTLLHNEIETVFAKRYDINSKDIRPWHYEDLFAQSAPAIFEINLDQYYKKTNIPEIANSFYVSASIPVKDILDRSDLYERKGKNQHAYSFCIDRKQDIRILCNLVPNERWMNTMLHELGHAIYEKYIDQSLPFLLREPAHSFTTEGVAMFFGSYASNANWMQNALQISDKEKSKIEKVTRANLRLSKLIFARWSMVVFNFEKSFYQNPDQDLNKLWWDLVEKYQLIKRPDNSGGTEWATKIHIAAYPVYYQNYQLGELFASQILNYIAENFYNNASIDEVVFWQKPEAGDYLRDKVFLPAKKLPWNEMINGATGEPLSARFFIKQYVTTM
jgi:peptidyl-dipeptidase A